MAERENVEVVRLPDIDLRPNEASGLQRIEAEALLDAKGWDRGFWVVLDEVPAEECVAAIGHRRSADLTEGWETLRLVAEPSGDEGRTGDAEAVATRDGWVYVFGSQHGGKSGPIRTWESWIARFRESEVRVDADQARVTMDIRRLDLGLHRLVNDALREHGVDVVALGADSRAAFIDATIAGDADDAPDEEPASGRVRPDDTTINVEGADFRPDGSVLLGLRFPTASDGRPILVQLGDLEPLFAPERRLPPVEGFWLVDAIGRDGDMAGVRDLTTAGDDVHLVTGNIDSKAQFSVLLGDHPGGQHTVATHFVCTLPAGATGGEVAARAVREFPALPRVEGIELDADGEFFYVTDEDEGVKVRCTTLLSG